MLLDIWALNHNSSSQSQQQILNICSIQQGIQKNDVMNIRLMLIKKKKKKHSGGTEEESHKRLSLCSAPSPPLYTPRSSVGLRQGEGWEMPDILGGTGLGKYLPFPSKVISMVTKAVKGKSALQRKPFSLDSTLRLHQKIQKHIRHKRSSLRKATFLF